MEAKKTQFSQNNPKEWVSADITISDLKSYNGTIYSAGTKRDTLHNRIKLRTHIWAPFYNSDF